MYQCSENILQIGQRSNFTDVMKVGDLPVASSYLNCRNMVKYNNENECDIGQKLTGAAA